MSTLFLKHSQRRSPPLTYFLIEAYAHLSESNPEADAKSIIKSALKFVGCSQVVREEDLSKLLQEIMKQGEKISKISKGGKDSFTGSGKGKQFGTDYLKWVSGLNVEQLLLVISDYDFDLAYKYYSQVQIEIVETIADLYMKDKWLLKQSHLEASIIGTGGSLGKDSGDDGFGFGTEAAEQQSAKKLRALGF